MKSLITDRRRRLKNLLNLIELPVPVDFVPYAKACVLVQKAGLKGKTEFSLWNRPTNIPSNPNVTYKGKGWISWGTFFGTGNVRKKEFLDYSKVKSLVRKAGISSIVAFNAWEKPAGVPSHPHTAYPEWTNWKEFFGTGTTNFLSYAGAKIAVRKAGIQNKKDFLAWKRPAGIPVAPYNFYKRKGWIDWYDFLEKQRAGQGSTQR